MRAAADSHRHRVTASGERGLAVHGDPVRLIQVLCNLLSNAIKYTPEGGKIRMLWGRVDGEAFVRVSDNGRGIAPELLPRIFDMFVQERVTPDGSGGLGLGLGLAKRLVELHQGSVRAESDGAGKGAMFEIRLPIADTADDATTQTTTRDSYQARRLRAVVVDDAADLRELVAELLRMKGHQVQTVEDGPSALALIRAERPDVALIDIGLPEMDGYEVARTLRRELSPHQLRLIAMTGYGQATDRANALAAGFDAHIVKPASADKIMRALYGITAEDP
jgi:CheY-like chemotaxis protein